MDESFKHFAPQYSKNKILCTWHNRYMNHRCSLFSSTNTCNYQTSKCRRLHCRLDETSCSNTIRIGIYNFIFCKTEHNWKNWTLRVYDFYTESPLNGNTNNSECIFILHKEN